MNTGYIYTLHNRSFGEHVIKIGRTTREPYIRAKEIYTNATGVPEPFDIVFAYRVSNCEIAEKKIHKKLQAYRYNKNREFFILSIEVAKKIISNTCQEVDRLLGCSTKDPVFINYQPSNDLDLSLEDNYFNDSDKIVLYRLDEIKKRMLSPPGTSSLTNEQKERIEVIAEIFLNVLPEVSEKWLIDFSRDQNPEREICIWENIAKAFLKVEQVKYLSEKQKEEAFYLLLFRSMMPASKVLQSFPYKTFCKRAAKEILRGYEDSPKPITMGVPTDRI